MKKQVKKRVLIFTPTIGRGGVHLVARVIFAALAKFAPADWEFEVLGQTFTEHGLRMEYPSQWTFTQLDPHSTLPAAGSEQFEWLWHHNITFYLHLKRMVEEGKFDMVYCISPWWVIRAYEWSLGVPFVCNIPDFAWDVMDMSPPLVQHFTVASAFIRERATHTIFSAAYWQRHALKKYAFDEDTTSVIQSSADFVASDFTATPQEAERVRAKYGLPEHYVLAFHCMYHKMPILILRAQRRARIKSALVPPLVMAGIGTEHLLSDNRVDDHIDQVRQMMAQVQVTPGVDFFVPGQVPEEDVAGLYAGATVSVNASNMEGDLAGNTLNSFMAHCPHIYSALPVYVERIGREKFGYSFTPGEYVDLAQRLIDVCEDRSEARRRAVAAHGWAVERNVEDVVEEYLRLFGKVINA